MTLSPPEIPAAAFMLPASVLDEVYGAEGVAEITQHARLVHPPVSREELAAQPHPWTQEVEVLFTSWQAPVLDAAMLARFPRLRAVFYGAGSIRYLATPEFWRRGILLTTAASANAVPVSEYTLASTLMGLKRMWPFELEVVAYDPYLSSTDATELDVRLLPLAELFATCSVVSLHAPRLPATIGMITGELIASMKPNATLINTSRGTLVKEDELCEALRHRPDLQVVLDVTDPEPPAPGSPLYSLLNVVLTPHIAGSRGRERRRLGELMITEFHRFRRGQPLQHAVSEARAMTMA
ncbi:MAG: hydroxyacid dehydrogenase [Candidatus Synoicihabitans palmerolidicus]|nr:hydroxyacid dehydrogenase [Candidatus Synoicihabitans palmerolidicus]